MSERLKREVKDKAHLRRGERTVHFNGDHVPTAGATRGDWTVLSRGSSEGFTTSIRDVLDTASGSQADRTEPCPQVSTVRAQRGTGCPLAGNGTREIVAFGRSDTILMSFYLENVLPFLFPFYRPSIFHGGTAWILEMMISSPVIRRATLCQSSYFFSLAQDAANRGVIWETVLTQTKGTFEMLRQSLQIIDGSDVTEHLHGAVRIMASIMQVQRFEIAVSSFGNSHAHLNAALALFRQLVDSSQVNERSTPRSRFDTVMSRLGPPSQVLPAQCSHVPSAEQAAFRFSTGLLLFDDIIASTALQMQPRLYDYHSALLLGVDGNKPLIDFEDVVGCPNTALLQIAETTVLETWKQRCTWDEDLDVMELVRRATPIKATLMALLTRTQSAPPDITQEGTGLLGLLTADDGQHAGTNDSKDSLIACVWTHAALAYLSIIVNGWQTASADIRHHVGQILMRARHISPLALLRTMVWPFCVAGCLAEPSQEAAFRELVEGLQPSSVFGMLRKALEVMQSVWRNREAPGAAYRDLASYLNDHGHLILLV